MDLKLFRYNKDYYILDGRIDNKILNVLSIYNTIENYQRKIINNCDLIIPIVYVPMDLANKLTHILKKFKINLVFIEDIENYIYYGEKNDEVILMSLFYYIDDKGNYIYILDSEDLNYNNVFPIESHPSYSLNYIELYNIPNIKRKIYLEDYISNTNILVNKEYQKYFYNKSKYLDLYKIINRIILAKKTTNCY